MKKDESAGHQSFDFEYWKKLAKDNPELFERKRRDALEAVINSAPCRIQQRLRGLQWRVDMERQRAKNPLNSCLRIYNMMWESVYAKGGLLDSMDSLLSPADAKSDTLHKRNSGEKADVLAFRASRQ